MKYLDQSHSSKWQTIHSVEKQLLDQHLASILNKELNFLLEENRIEDLQLMYSLLGRVKNGQVELCSKMAEYVKKRVIKINPEKDKTMVQELLDVNWKEEIGQYLKSYLRSNDKFVTCEESI